MYDGSIFYRIHWHARHFIDIYRTFLEDTYKQIVQHTDMPRGGHFAALEEPKLLADDVISFVQKVEKLRNQQK